jgi:hypothetical protein
MSVPLSQDNGSSMVNLAKPANEIEKEMELPDGQRPNFINGIWHCSNCGCPEGIAIGRRKGPLGDKTQCGKCGAESRTTIFKCECSD